MGEKDLSQKSLEYYPDVFADCANALLYEGERVLAEGTLLPAPTETIYPDAGGRLRSQLQDVSKFEMEGGRIRAQYTIENQMHPDRGMVLRKAGYEGAIYRRQYAEGRTSPEGGGAPEEGAAGGNGFPAEDIPAGRSAYPVISMVLYWGRPGWNGPRSLRHLTEGRLPEEARRYVDDVRIHVYEMARLPAEVRRRFRSDMRIAVDYLAEGSGYVPTDQKIRHAEALLRLLRELTGDDRYERILDETLREEDEKEGITMCELLDRYWNGGVAEGEARGRAAGRAEGVAEGRAEGRAEGKAESVGNIRSMHSHKLSVEAIAELIGQEPEYVSSVIVLCVRYPMEDDVAIAKRLLVGEVH